MGYYPYLLHNDDTTTAIGEPGSLSRRLLLPYIPGLNLTSNSLTGIFLCPSVNDPATRQRDRAIDWATNNYFTFDYAYFARVDDWDLPARGSVTHPELITARDLVSDRVLMTDVIFRLGPTAWTYNHGRFGDSYAGVYHTSAPNSAEPDISGFNRLFGDGHVAWEARGPDLTPADLAASVPPATRPRVLTLFGSTYTIF